MSSPANFNPVYFLCAAGYATGGTELAHQAANQLRCIGVDARMLYMPSDESPVNSRFSEYNVPWTYHFEDSCKATVIIPETSLGYVHEIKRARKIAWWMSVDNFLTYASVDDLIKNRRWGRVFATLKRTTRERFGFRALDLYANRRIRLRKDAARFDLHFYQSEYARQFLTSYNISNVTRLSDYINDYYLNIDLGKAIEKENIVLYNPSKGLSVTKKLMKLVGDIEWVPLQGYTLEQMRSILSRAKVYVDFGNHPGKDRIPREAAVSGCIVVTNRIGSAANSLDIPIAEEFKVSTGRCFWDTAANIIRKNIINYDSQFEKQAEYRDFILSEKNIFKGDLIDFSESLRK